MVKEAVKELFEKKIVKDFLKPLIDAVVQDAIHGTTPTKLFDALGNIIKGQIWNRVKAGPLKLVTYLHDSMFLHAWYSLHFAWIFTLCANLTELVKKSKFYRNVIEDISDNVEAYPVLDEAKDFTLGRAEEQLMDDFFESVWDLLKPDLTEDVDLPLIVSRDPVSL